MRSRRNSQAPSVTKAGAVLPISVALAMVVRLIAQCHTPMSPAKQKPAKPSQNMSRRVSGARTGWRRSETVIISSRSGKAMPMR